MECMLYNVTDFRNLNSLYNAKYENVQLLSI